LSLRERLRSSLYARSLLFIVAGVSVGAIALSVAAYSYARVAADEAYDRLLVGGVIQLAENIFVQGGVIALDPPAAALASLSAYDLVFYSVTDTRGIVVAGYPDLAFPGSVTAAQKGAILSDGTYQGSPVRIAAIGRYLSTPSVTGWAYVVLAQTREARFALARDLTLRAVLIIAAMSLLTLLAGGLAIRYALAPLARIEQELAARDPNDLRPLSIETPTEIHTLVSAISMFMERLSGRIRIMQRFIGDAAHQIRTPLAALDAQVELLSTTRNSAQRQAQIERIQHRSTELRRLTNQLLSHAMVIHRSDAVAMAQLDLVALARTVLADAVPLSFHREVRIAFQAPEQAIMIAADAVSLREALSNVIHNALTHGALTALTVTVSQDGAQAMVEVFDDGPGIPASEWASVIAPFTSGSTGKGGSGLGLAIASDVIRSHSGSIRFAMRADGFAVVLVLPLASP
jgi:two-component system sensor histidine kinase TctE